MHEPSKALMLAATVHLAVIAAPSVALAQSQDSRSPALPALPALPPPASAPPPSAGDDIIYMKNGGLLRGTIIEAVPDVQARIQLATGEIANVPWPQIGRIEHGGALPPAPGGKPEPPPSEVWVHVDAPEGVLLQQDVTSNDNWQTVCSAPCDKLLPTRFYYRVTGGGIKSSEDFALRASPGTHERVVVDGASKSAFVIGVVGLTGGIVVGYVGLFVTYAAALLSFGEADVSGVADTGLAMMGIGALMAVVGLVVVLVNAKTKVNQDLGAGQTGLLLPGSWTRTPMWSTAVTEQRNLSPVVGIPIFSGRF